jgi:hypothetical protein
LIALNAAGERIADFMALATRFADYRHTDARSRLAGFSAATAA